MERSETSRRSAESGGKRLWIVSADTQDTVDDRYENAEQTSRSGLAGETRLPPCTLLKHECCGT